MHHVASFFYLSIQLFMTKKNSKTKSKAKTKLVAELFISPWLLQQKKKTKQ